VTGADFVNLRQMRKLGDLALEGLFISSSEVAGISTLDSLQRLFMKNTSLPGDPAFADLIPTNLEFLRLDRSLCSRQLLSNESLKNKLKTLILVNTRISESALLELEGYKKLECLILAGSQQDPGTIARFLPNIKSLRRLDVSGLVLDGNDIQAVTSHDGLRSVGISFYDMPPSLLSRIKNRNIETVSVSFADFRQVSLVEHLNVPELMAFFVFQIDASPGVYRGIAKKHPLLEWLEFPEGAGIVDIQELHNLEKIRMVSLPSTIVTSEVVDELQKVAPKSR
jgi:hypothetical protein